MEYKWQFVRKFRWTLIITFLLVTLSAFGIAGTIYMTSVRKLNMDNLERQVDQITLDYDQYLSGLKEQMIEIMVKPAIQKYCRAEETDARQIVQAKECIRQIVSGNQDLLFAYVFSRRDGDYVGYQNIRETRYDINRIREYMEHVESHPQNRGTIKAEYTDTLIKDEKAWLMMYPLYSNRIIGEQYGTIVIAAPSTIGLYEHSSVTTKNYVTDLKGNVVCGDTDWNADKDWMKQANDDKKLFDRNGYVVACGKLKNWNLYAFASASKAALYREGLVGSGIFLFLSLVVVMIATIASSLISRRILKPINLILDRMNHVSEEVLNEPIEMPQDDSDSRYLAGGFNRMIEQIQVLRQTESERQKEADTLRFNLLQSQIQPHFLYNILDSIHWKAVLNDDDEVSEMVRSLASFYRMSLSGGEEIVPIQTEIRQVQEYVRLQNIRYNDLVELLIDIPGVCQSIRLPKMSLQPLIENAIYHGFRNQENISGLIHISAEMSGETVLLRVSDNGKGMSREALEKLNHSIQGGYRQEGFGVINVNSRIRLFFGEEYGLCYSQNESGGITVTISLPKQEEAKEENV